MTAREIAENARIMSVDEVEKEINKLITKTENKLSVLLTENDYKEFYELAKEYWVAFDMPIKGNAKDIKEQMWKSFEEVGIVNVHSKKDFLSTSKMLYQKLDVKGKLYEICMMQ